MRRYAAILLACAAALWGCGLFAPSRETAAPVEDRLWLADSLEREGLFQRAAVQYALVAEKFPNSDLYPTAVRRAALLFAVSPSSPRNDSAAYRWYQAYLALPLKKSERENVRVSFELLNRVIVLHKQIARLYTAADSLTFLNKAQAAAAGNADRRIQDLELALQRAQAELQKIRETDIRLSKTKVR